jgi:hypothetical protein
MGGLGMGVVLWANYDSWTDLFLFKQIWLQLLLGGGYGILIAGLGMMLVRQPVFGDAKKTFKGMIREIKPNFLEILWYSFCAAVGEEILFRGAVQYYIGIWPTAIIFVAIHGYINPFDKPMLLFSIYLILAVAGFGYLVVGHGMFAAMLAHFIYDVLMFMYLTRLND